MLANEIKRIWADSSNTTEINSSGQSVYALLDFEMGSRSRRRVTPKFEAPALMLSSTLGLISL